jgi:hypothetical protein
MMEEVRALAEYAMPSDLCLTRKSLIVLCMLFFSIFFYQGHPKTDWNR